MFKIKKTDRPKFDLLRKELDESINKGIQVGNIEKEYNEYKEQLDTYRTIMLRDYSVENPNSTKQVARYLEWLAESGNSDVHEICYQNGKYVTDGETLSKLAETGNNFAQDMINYRANKKIVETLQGLLTACDDEGRIRPDIQISKTNRINYKNPALMNIPKNLLWNVIVPRDKDKQLISIDIKNQEPCILINMLNIQSLKFALTDERGLYEAIFGEIYKPTTYLYIHAYTKGLTGVVDNYELSELGYSRTILSPIPPSAKTTYYQGRRVFNIDVANTFVDEKGNAKVPSKVTITTEATEANATDFVPRYGNIRREEVEVEWIPKQMTTITENKLKRIPGIVKGLEVKCIDESRTQFKTCWNALNYGGSHMIVESNCKDIDGDLLYDYFNSIEELNKFKEYCKSKARHFNRTIHTYFGTEVCADDYLSKNQLIRSLRDLPIQGTGADILALLVEHFKNEVEARGYKDKLDIYFTRHDEIVIEAANDWVNNLGKDKIVEILRDIFEHQIEDWSPFRVEIDFIEHN